MDLHGAFKFLLCGMWVGKLTSADFEILILIQTLWLFLNVFWQPFGMTFDRLRDLMFPCQQNFDSKVFRSFDFFKFYEYFGISLLGISFWVIFNSMVVENTCYRNRGMEDNGSKSDSNQPYHVERLYHNGHCKFHFVLATWSCHYRWLKMCRRISSHHERTDF